MPKLRKYKAQINNLPVHLKELEKEQMKHKISKRKEIRKIKVQINEMRPKK